MTCRRLTILLLLLAPAAGAAAPSQTTHQAVPATPVGARDLAAPKFHSDMRDLQNIVGKEEGKSLPVGKVDVGSPIDQSPQPVLPVIMPTPAPEAKPEPEAPQSEHTAAERKERLRAMFDGLQSITHDWHDLIEILFTGAILFFLRRFTLVSQRQHKHMVRAVRAAEMAAEAAKKSAEIAEHALKNANPH